jgi:hypothetical protein
MVFGPSGRNDRSLDLYVASSSTNSVLHYDGRTRSYLGEFVSGDSSKNGGLICFLLCA